MPRHPSRAQIDLGNQIAELPIVDDGLEELGILPPTFRFVLIKKIVQADGCAAERVCFDDVRAGFEIAAMDFVDDLRLGEEENFEAALKILSLPIRESLA